MNDVLLGYSIHVSVVSPIERLFSILALELNLTTDQLKKTLPGYEVPEDERLLNWTKDDLGGLAEKIIADDVDVSVFEPMRKSWRKYIESRPK